MLRRSHDNQVDGTRADDLLGDIERLLPVVGLRDIEAVHVDAQRFGIGGVEGVLGVMMIALPPCFCTSAIAWIASVVLPEDSGP